MGRPPLDNPSRVRADRLTITLTKKEKEAIRKGARDEEKTASTLTREAVLTDPAVVRHLVLDVDFVTVRLLAHDWLNRTEQMVDYFEGYIPPKQLDEFEELIDSLRDRVRQWEEVLPLAGPD